MKARLFLVFLLVFLSACTQGKEDLGYSEKVKVYYNDPFVLSRPSSSSDSPIGRALIETIDDAKDSLDVALYGMRNQTMIYEALMRALDRGVKVRLVVDLNADGTSDYKDTYRYLKLIQASRTDYEADVRKLATYVPRAFNPENLIMPIPEGYEGKPQQVGYSLDDHRAIIAVLAGRTQGDFTGDTMHHKFVVADESMVWLGSANASDADTGGYNANVAAIIKDPNVAKAFVDEFNQMYDHGRFHQEKFHIHSVTLPYRLTDDLWVQLAFGPQDAPADSLVIPAIQKASSTIRISMFYLTNKDITGALIEAKKRGVAVKVLLDAQALTSGYAKHIILRKAGIQVKVENWGPKLHSKMMIVDEEVLLLGSMNFTESGNDQNDENFIAIHGSFYAKEGIKEFEKLWESVPDKYLAAVPMAESSESIGSLHDWVDNDYDGRIDWLDEIEPEPISWPNVKIVPRSEGYGLIKGVVSKYGDRFYLLPSDQAYAKYKVDSPDEAYYPSVFEALEAGFVPYNRQAHEREPMTPKKKAYVGGEVLESP